MLDRPCFLKTSVFSCCVIFNLVKLQHPCKTFHSFFVAFVEAAAIGDSSQLFLKLFDKLEYIHPKGQRHLNRVNK